MTNTKTKKSAKQKKVLIASILLAGLIAAGGTFAWFTSQDEVTNQLSASNNYGVSITESFTPPEQWTPGQKINKDVSVINTGNIDAFVRVKLTNSINVTVLDSTGTATGAFDTTDKSTLVELTSDEVTALQAGGVLAYAAGQTITDNTPGTDFDASSSGYGSGLYVFQRTINPESSNVEFKGYYYDGTSKYYALQTISAPVDPSTDYTATLQTKKELATKDLKFNYTNVDDTTDPYIIATYAGQDGADATADDIIINIHLNPNYTATWTKGTDSTETAAWFYYNTDVEAGAITEKLVDFVELDEDVSNSAYLDFAYDLKINMESVQVTLDDNGAETTDAVPAGWTVTPTPTEP